MQAKMTTEQFDALLDARADLQERHELACSAVDEEQPRYQGAAREHCRALYAQLCEVQEQIDIALSAEQTEEAAKERAA